MCLIRPALYQQTKTILSLHKLQTHKNNDQLARSLFFSMSVAITQPQDAVGVPALRKAQARMLTLSPRLLCRLTAR